jgi:hypothetical protein
MFSCCGQIGTNRVTADRASPYAVIRADADNLGCSRTDLEHYRNQLKYIDNY